jgi:hypothetical protein
MKRAITYNRRFRTCNKGSCAICPKGKHNPKPRASLSTTGYFYFAGLQYSFLFEFVIFTCFFLASSLWGSPTTVAGTGERGKGTARQPNGQGEQRTESQDAKSSSIKAKSRSRAGEGEKREGRAGRGGGRVAREGLLTGLLSDCCSARTTSVGVESSRTEGRKHTVRKEWRNERGER